MEVERTHMQFQSYGINFKVISKFRFKLKILKTTLQLLYLGKHTVILINLSLYGILLSCIVQYFQVVKSFELMLNGRAIEINC